MKAHYAAVWAGLSAAILLFAVLKLLGLGANYLPRANSGIGDNMESSPGPSDNTPLGSGGGQDSQGQESDGSPKHLIEPARSKPTLDDILAGLPIGEAVFNVPDHMRLGRTQSLEASLGIKVPKEELEASVTAEGQKKTVKLRIAPRMQAMLNGGGAFDISPSGAQLQLISAIEPNHWSWEVTPKLEGQQVLVLTIDAIVTVDGKDGPHTITTLREPIEVNVGWPRGFAEWAEWFKKWAEYVGWFWAAVPVVWLLLAKKKWLPASWQPKEGSEKPSAAERRRRGSKR